MKNKEYIVLFDTGQHEVVQAGREEEATVLAQALQITKGNQWDVVLSVTERTKPERSKQ